MSPSIPECAVQCNPRLVTRRMVPDEAARAEISSPRTDQLPDGREPCKALCRKGQDLHQTLYWMATKQTIIVKGAAIDYHPTAETRASEFALLLNSCKKNGL